MGFFKKNGFSKTKSPAAKHANCAGTVCEQKKESIHLAILYLVSIFYGLEIGSIQKGNL